MQSEPYGSPQNPMLFDLIINDNVNFIIDNDSVSPCADSIQISFADLDAELNRTNTLQNRKVLRVRSEVQARRIRDSIKRIVLF